jgi:hypothetical protein
MRAGASPSFEAPAEAQNVMASVDSVIVAGMGPSGRHHRLIRASQQVGRPATATESAGIAKQESPADAAAPPAPPARPGCASADLDCNGDHSGRGAFAKPPQLWVGKPDDLRFAVGLTDAAIARELAPGDSATGSAPVNIGRCMRVTLEKSGLFDIVGPNGEIRRLAHDMGRASWSWTVLPKQAGRAEARAKVQVLKAAAGRCTEEAMDEYTESVAMSITIGRWRSFLDALASASSAGDVFAALFKSWEGALVSLTALLAAISGLVVAIRKLGPKGRARRAARREGAASGRAKQPRHRRRPKAD